MSIYYDYLLPSIDNMIKTIFYNMKLPILKAETLCYRDVSLISLLISMLTRVDVMGTSSYKGIYGTPFLPNYVPPLIT